MNSNGEYVALREKKVAEIEEILRKYLPEKEGHQKIIMEAMEYSLMAGGKRLRPMMMRETYRLFGGKEKIVEPFMAAIEMIHTYSLVHDDLPAMDNDDYRRGRKTTHIVYGEAMGILAGDGLLNYAFETALKAFDIEPGNVNIPKALGVLAKKAGIYGMIGGQTVDVELTGKKIDKAQIDFIFDLKTCAMIESSMMIGAILAGATTNEQKTIDSSAIAVGMAFQIRDYVLDVIGDEKEIGKPVLSDEKNDKTTYVTIEGIEKANLEVERLSKEAINGIRSLVVKNEFLINLIEGLIYRNK